MKYISYLGVAAICAISMTSCNNASEETASGDEAQEMQQKAPELVAVSASPEFDGASLSIGAVNATAVGKDSAKVTFDFAVKNYELTAQTADNETKLCNNSGKGQHIHFIMDNSPYKALYEPKNEITLANGTEHYLMAFLSRSYHESVKSEGAAILFHFRVDEKGKVVKMDNPETPMVFYSRPKGDYIGKDTANVLLDFYVWNGQLAADGYKVNANIVSANGESTSYTFDKWEPKFIQGLAMGKNKVTLTLTDKDGTQVEGANTTVTREFTTAAGEPMN